MFISKLVFDFKENFKNFFFLVNTKIVQVFNSKMIFDCFKMRKLSIILKKV